jgi:hypothetical protein
MGYVQNIDGARGRVDLQSIDWESLGRAVQSRSLEAVARHFFEVGLAELCLDALAGTRESIAQESNNE